jgi:hypothetical protein
LGIDLDGVKHPLALAEGTTENATLVCELLVGLRERGLDVTRQILAVIDGSKVLRCAVNEIFDHPVIQRCQLHYADLPIMPNGRGWPFSLFSSAAKAHRVGIIRPSTRRDVLH